ncbi:O-antigen ligase family protein [Paramicrobacterium sp. CJ85]|uniref:O-antigen ligase family protein n=1 Tax=Paramicrobacterium sp. CJ85 TaxID=3445355 RepID=UPI003F5DB8B8
MGAVAAVVIYTVLAIFAIFSPAKSVRRNTVTATLLTFLLVHSEVRQTTIALLLVLIAHVVLIMRTRRVPIPPLALAGFVLWMSMRSMLAVNQLEDLGIYAVTGVVLCLTAGTIFELGEEAVGALKATTAVTIVVEFTVAVGERFFSLPALWPRRDGVTYFVDGSNNLWEGLGGRAMGSLGWAITLGEVVAILTILAAWFFLRSWNPAWLLLAGAGLFTIFLSGTRTGLLMLIGAAIIAALSRRSRLWGIFAVAFVVIILAAGSQMVALDWLGFDGDLETSRSVTHRRLVSESFLPLFVQAPLNVLFGHGYDAVPQMLLDGTIQGAPGVPVTDNEFVRTMAGLGAVGIALWAAASFVALVRGPAVTRALIVAISIGAFSYDIFSWRSMLFLTVSIFALNLHPDSSSQSSSYEELETKSVQPHKT